MSKETVVKTTLYLPSSDYRRLKAIARAQGRTAASLVREAVAEYARKGAATRPSSIGMWRSGRSDLAGSAEELLEGMGEDE